MYIIDKINMLFGISLNNENLYFFRLGDGILTSIKLFLLNNNFINKNKGMLNSIDSEATILIKWRNILYYINLQ